MTQIPQSQVVMVDLVNSTTDKFAKLIDDKAIGTTFSWIEFRDTTLLKIIEFSCGFLNYSDKELYLKTFNSRMAANGYLLKAVNSLEDKVEAWHEGDGHLQELHEYLSLTWQDYNHFVHGTPVYIKNK